MNNTDEKIRSELNAVCLLDLLHTQREKGRRYLSSSDDEDAREFRRYWNDRYNRATRLLEDEGRGRRIRQLATLLKEVSYSIHAMATDPGVSYYRYTEVHVIDWYLRPTHASFIELKRRALQGVYSLLCDLSQFEADSLVNIETRHSGQLSKDVVTKRIHKIGEAVSACRDVFQAVDLAWPGPRNSPPAYQTLEEYVMEPTRLSALIHLTCFPRTISHDEVVFLRTIHLGELCFFALRVIAIETIETLRRRQLAKAAKCLAQGAIIGKLLHRTFVVLNTMPRKHFEDFREYTEHASAVQSRGYQLFDIYYRSVDARKEEVFGKTPSLFDLCRFRHESFVSLKAIISDPTLRGLPGWDPVEANARELDESLKSWRGLHIAFAIKYLQGITPPTGGTAGEPYLRVFLDEGLFSDTVIDKSLLQRLSSDAEWQELISYVPVGYGVAPPAEKRGLTLPRVDPTK